MIQLFWLSLIFISISFLILSLNFILSKKSFINREKSSPFECGFDPISSAHLPFSTHFFVISLIFLIFDIEIAALIPIIYMFNLFSPSLIITSLIFILILTIGLYIEYLEQSIDWKK